MNIRYKVVNADKVAEWIKSLPRGIKAAAMREISTYIVGDANHGLKHDVAYKYVSRKRAYGKVSDAPAGYFSWKQFRYVMAKLASGEMKIGRKNDPTKYSQSWKWEQVNSQWDRTQIHGKIPFDRFPSRQNKLVGWRHYMQVIQSNMKGAMAAAQKKVDEFIRKKSV
jgi:hypothetical protein